MRLFFKLLLKFMQKKNSILIMLIISLKKSSNIKKIIMNMN